jgi:chemotaxis protein histidine kinase CheA
MEARVIYCSKLLKAQRDAANGTNNAATNGRKVRKPRYKFDPEWVEAVRHNYDRDLDNDEAVLRHIRLYIEGEYDGSDFRGTYFECAWILIKAEIDRRKARNARARERRQQRRAEKLAAIEAAKAAEQAAAEQAAAEAARIEAEAKAKAGAAARAEAERLAAAEAKAREEAEAKAREEAEAKAREEAEAKAREEAEAKAREEAKASAEAEPEVDKGKSTMKRSEVDAVAEVPRARICPDNCPRAVSDFPDKKRSKHKNRSKRRHS